MTLRLINFQIEKIILWHFFPISIEMIKKKNIKSAKDESF